MSALRRFCVAFHYVLLWVCFVTLLPTPLSEGTGLSRVSATVILSGWVIFGIAQTSLWFGRRFSWQQLIGEAGVLGAFQIAFQLWTVAVLKAP